MNKIQSTPKDMNCAYCTDDRFGPIELDCVICDKKTHNHQLAGLLVRPPYCDDHIQQYYDGMTSKQGAAQR